MLVTDPAALSALIDGARLSLFRLETLDRYDDGSDGDDFGRYMAGEPGPDPERKARWHKVLQADLERIGERTRRVHVVRSPLSDYLRYEFEWGYAHNLACEDIRILDLAEKPDMSALAETGDFWLIDRERAAVMCYDSDGRYLGFGEPSGRPGRGFSVIADSAWVMAEPFSDWWDNHPQYHRDSRVAA